MGHQDLNTFVKRFKGRFSFLASVSETSKVKRRKIMVLGSGPYRIGSVGVLRVK